MSGVVAPSRNWPGAEAKSAQASSRAIWRARTMCRVIGGIGLCVHSRLPGAAGRPAPHNPEGARSSGYTRRVMLRDRWHHRHATLFSAMAAVFLSLLAVSCGSSTAGAIIVLKANTDVGPVMQQYIDRGISRAETDHAKLVVIELDTPGGLDTSMRAIVQRIERSKVPIVVYVYPAGARAASAGTFITMAANVAVMAPNTSIGAASPINADGSNITGTL